MRRLIIATASVIALGAGLSFTGTTPADASSHPGRHAGATQQSAAEIKQVQQKLQADNLYHGKIDGRLGRATRRAIADYQKQNNLHVTSNLDRQTRDSLLGSMGTTTPPAGSTGTTPAAPGQGGMNMPATPGQGGTPPGGAPGQGSATGR